MKTNQMTARGRTTRALLMTGVALGGAFAMSTFMAPGHALAANECGVQVGSTVTCTSAGNPFNGGITYTPTADLTVVLDGTVNENATAGNGVTINATNYNSTVQTLVGSVVKATGLGISVTTNNANATINNAGAVTSGNTALRAAVNGTGNASVTNSGALNVTTATFNAAGIASTAANGNASVNNTGAINVGGTSTYLNGILATAAGAGHTATVTGSGPITVSGSGSAMIGVNANGAAGAYVTATGPINVTNTNAAAGYAIGVQAQGGTGNVTINIGDVTATGYSAQGIALLSGDPTKTVTVNFHNVTSNTTGATAGGDGLNIYAAAGAPVTITGNAVTTTGAYNDGIKVGGGGGIAGNTSVTVNSVSTTGYHSDGIVIGGAGTQTVNVGSVTTTGDYARGVVSNGKGGAVNITVGAIVAKAPTGGISTSGFESYAVRATNTGSGTITINNNGVIKTTGVGAYAIGASAVDGNVAVNNAGSITTTGTTGSTQFGVVATTSGKGSISLTNSGSITTAATDATGLYAHATGTGGASVVNSGTIKTTGADAYGVYAHTTSGAASASNSGTINTSGVFGYGVYARADTTGTASGSNSGTITTSGANATGVRVKTFGAGAATGSNTGTISTTGANAVGLLGYSAGGTVTLTQSGTITTSAAGTDGVFASTPGVGTVTVNGTGTTNVSGAGSEAIYARSGGGAVSITTGTANATGTGAANAIHAISGTSSAVTVNGLAHSTNANGVLVAAGTTGSVTVGTGATVEGVNGINITSATGSTITNSGTIRPLNTATGFAITAGGAGAATVTNNASGTITGGLSLTAQNDTFTNVGTFNGVAASNFGAGNDTVNNGAAFNASANIDFGTGTDTFNNLPGGSLNVAPTASTPTTITFTGLEAFNNAGNVNLGNGHAGDILALPGTTFTGTGASTLTVDVNLGAGTTDQLQIGTGAGATTVNVNRIGTSAGAFGETLPVVVASSATPATAFTLAGGRLDTGFVQFTMQFNPTTNTFALVGSPDIEAFEMGRAAAAGQTFWNETSDVWQARMQEVRDSSWASEPTRGEGWEMWAQAHIGGQEVSQTRTITAFGTTTTSNLGMDSDWRGFQMGADTMHGPMMWGVTAGFQQQESRLHADRNSFDLEGWNIGAYAGWTSGHFFLNGLVKGDWYSVDANMHTVPAMLHFDGNTWGVTGETGFRFGGSHFWVEPLLSANWSSTHLDNASSGGVDFGFHDAKASTGKAGVRFGAEWGSIIPYIGVYAADTWEGKNQTTLTTGASSFTFTDQPAGSYGLVDFGFTTKSWNGLEGFLKGESYFSGHTDGFSGRLGVRWRW